MKFKTLGRIGRGVTAAAAGLFGYQSGYYLSKADYDLVPIFSSDLPVSTKLLGAGAYVFLGTALPLLSLIATDGVTDIAKGTHHYFGCRVWQRLTRDEETRDKIERELEHQLRRIEEEI